jgi:hypothetical protein
VVFGFIGIVIPLYPNVLTQAGRDHLEVSSIVIRGKDTIIFDNPILILMIFSGQRGFTVLLMSI